jgi:hypothetical protein
MSSYRNTTLGLFGLTPSWTDSRPAHISLAIARIAIFSAMLWIHFILVAALLEGDIAGFVAQRASGAYFPAGLLLLFGSEPPSATFFETAKWLSLVSTVMAVIGLMTRPAMVVSLITTLLLALLDLSRYEFWSHPYHPIFLAAIPFVFAQAGSVLSVDRWLYKRFGWGFGKRTEPVFWAVLASQYAVALFYFGAFWAKIYVSNGGFDYIFSDNMRNILAVTWSGYMEYPIPWYIELIASVPLFWMAMAAVHLVMQALPIAVVYGVNRPWLRLAEGLNFALGAIGLRIFMSVSNPWWLLLTALFIDWDHYLYRFRKLTVAAGNYVAPLVGRRAIGAYLAIFFGVYITAFATQKSNGWRLYPFDQLNMYAAVYASEPIRGHMPYAHILRGNLSIQLPADSTLDQQPSRWVRVDNLEPSARLALMPSISRKWTVNDPILYRIDGDRLNFPSIPDIFHLMSRLDDLDEIEAGLQEFKTFAQPLPQFPAGSVLVLRRQDVAFQPYPRPLSEKKVLHEGAKGVMNLADGTFAGVRGVLDKEAGEMNIHTKGTVKVTSVLWRPMYPEGIKTVQASELAGEWVTPSKFIVDGDTLAGLPKGYINLLLRAETPFGTFDFDGPYFYH